MSLSLSLLDAETGTLSFDWIVLTVVILGTCASVLGSVGDDFGGVRAEALTGAVVSADPCEDAARTCALR